MKTEVKMQSREYLTEFLRRRSVIAFCCAILTLALAFYGIIAGVNVTIERFQENGFTSFIYYTMISNTLAALSAAFVFPYTVEGIRNKRFAVPKWVAVMHYIATVTITITFVFVFFFMSWASPDEAFGGPNLFTHIFCPLLILILFFQMESEHLYSWKDRLLGVIPFCVYMAVYVIEVLVVGEESGGWPDIYHTQEYLPPVLTIAVMLLLAFGVSIAVALLSNNFTKKRVEKMFRFWDKDLDPVEVRIEAYGLGRMAARHSDENGVQIPYDILKNLADRYHMDPEDLMRPFVKGLMTGLGDRGEAK